MVYERLNSRNTKSQENKTMNQYFRNALCFVGAIVFVFGGLYLVDQYSGWRPFDGRVGTTAINGSAVAVSPNAEGGSAARRVPNDFSGSANETVTRQDRYDANTEQDSPMRRGRQSSLE